VKEGEEMEGKVYWIKDAIKVPAPDPRAEKCLFCGALMRGNKCIHCLAEIACF